MTSPKRSCRVWEKSGSEKENPLRPPLAENKSRRSGRFSLPSSCPLGAMAEPTGRASYETPSSKDDRNSFHNKVQTSENQPTTSQSPREPGGENIVILVAAREELGTSRAEASAQVWKKSSMWVLYTSLYLAAYVYSLESSTTYFYTPFATSAFRSHSLLSSVEVVSQLILGVGKPIIARIADLQSRSFAISAVTLYILGYILIASSHTVSQYAAGRVFQSAGSTGLQLISQIIVADVTPLKWRGFVAATLSAPYIVNAFIGSRIAASITTSNPSTGWRWGYGMFCLLVPAAVAPIVGTLVWGEKKAERLGLVKRMDQEQNKEPLLQKLKRFVVDLDLIGLILLTVGWGLLLVALTLSGGAAGRWNNPSIIAMVVVGPLILIGFGMWEIKWAKYPAIPGMFLRNRALMCSSFIAFFDFISYYLTALYLTSFLYVVKTPDWSQSAQNYFASTQAVGLTIFAILAGLVMRWTKRYKYLLIFGLVVRCIGVGIMIKSRGAHGSDAELILSQILQSVGGIVSITEFTAAQASVQHKHVAMALAFNLLITEIGGAIGSSIGGSIWVHLMPRYLAKYLPGTTEEQRATLFGSIVSIVALDPSDPIRVGAVQAYSDTMKILIIASLAFGLIPIILASIMPNFYLGDAQNAIDGLGITGRRVEEVDSRANSTRKIAPV